MSLILSGTDGLSDVDGSAATPAIRGTDTNTGIFFPAADTIAFSEGGAEAMRIDSSGNLALGNTSSLSATSGRVDLTINGTSSAMTSFGTGGTRRGYFLHDATDLTIASEVAGNIRFLNNGSERARITAAGNFLIGSTSDTNPLAIRRTGFTSTSRTANVMALLASNANGADGNIQFTDAVANNTWIGQNNSGAYVVCNVNGVRLASGGTSWASDSDERVKDIIEPIANATNKVSTLRAVIGKYKTDSEGTRRSFLIAQDVQAVLPEAVIAQPDEIGTLSLAYTDVIPLLVAAIKEQQALIETLTQRITSLEAKP
jgi:hypothetical protein